MSKSSVTIGFWLPTQALLLVMHYGGFVSNLPWWVVWFPSLLVLAGIALVFIFLFFVMVIAMVFG